MFKIITAGDLASHIGDYIKLGRYATDAPVETLAGDTEMMWVDRGRVDDVDMEDGTVFLSLTPERENGRFHAFTVDLELDDADTVEVEA